MSTPPPSVAIATEYQFRPVPPEFIVDWYHWIVRVVLIDHSKDLWIIKTAFEQLDADGNWVRPTSSGFQTHLPEALQMANKAQWTLEVNNYTAEKIMKKVASKR